MKKQIVVAIVQAAPVFNDLDASLSKLEKLAVKAAQEGAEIVVFGECWLAGYPVWLDYCPEMGLWDAAPTKAVFAEMVENSVEVPGAICKQLGSIAKENNIILITGINERTPTGTLYNSFLIFSNNGERVLHHRKLMPTYTEKMLYATGDAFGLKSVQIGGLKIGGLICWEHWMPHARQALHDTGEQIHIALWPNVHEMLQLASRSYAFEGRCFVMAAGQLLKAEDLPKALKLPDEIINKPDTLLLKGGSCVIGPDGKYMQKPVFDRETIIYERLNLDRIWQEKMALDVSGHYSRNDIFKFKVNRSRNLTSNE